MGYLFNYFDNQKKLKSYTLHPELTKDFSNSMISYLENCYQKFLKVPRIKEIMKDPAETRKYMYPVSTITFKNALPIKVCLGFDNTDENEGFAMFDSKEKTYYVCLNPSFFTKSKDAQIYILLHEIGHIRLSHTSAKNSYHNILTGAGYSEHRGYLSKKGKVMYPESNADLYAILNGADLYAILDSCVPKDFDKKYDYTSTNAEIAARYLNNYKKLKKWGYKMYHRPGKAAPASSKSDAMSIAESVINGYLTEAEGKLLLESCGVE